MAPRKKFSTEVMEGIARVLRRDYQKDFVQRFNFACQLEEKKRPAKAVNQIHQTVDHFARALAYAMDVDAKLNLRTRKGKRRKVGKPTLEQALSLLKDEAWLNLEQARKHLATGKFYSLHYYVSFRDQEIGRRLRSNLRKDQNEFAKYQKQHRELRSAWKPTRMPAKAGTKTMRETRAETKDIEASNLQLDTIAESLDQLLLKLDQILKNRITY
jgi:flagellin-specific chaperone FliS